MSEVIEWKNPPEFTDRLDRLISELGSRPNEWAVIEKYDGYIVTPWWSSLYNNDHIEIKVIVKYPEKGLNSPRDIYARFKEAEE